MVSETAASQLAMVVLPQPVWEGMTAELREIKEILIGRQEEELNNQWVESATARKMVGVSAKTWQIYRDERRIPFSQFGRKIYFKRGDIEAFLKAHYIEAR